MPDEKTARDIFLEKGNCPSISKTGAWCNGLKNHWDMHWAPYKMPNGKNTRVRWFDE